MAETKPKPGVFIADREFQVRTALVFLVEQVLGFQVVGEANSWPDLIRQLVGVQPEILVISSELVEFSHNERVAQLRVDHPPMKIIVLGNPSNSDEVHSWSGIDGWVSKLDPPMKLVSLFRSMAN